MRLGDGVEQAEPGRDLAGRRDALGGYQGAAIVVAALANLKAERYVADKDAKLALYGLDKPKRVIVLTLKGGDKRVLHIGGPVGGVFNPPAAAGR